MCSTAHRGGDVPFGSKLFKDGNRRPTGNPELMTEIA
jgi:hypothetical protein